MTDSSEIILPEHIEWISPFRLRAGGGVELSRLGNEIKCFITQDNRMLSDWLMDRAQKPLRIGCVVPHEGIEFTIRMSSTTRVHEVIIDLPKLKRSSIIADRLFAQNS